MPVPPSPVYAPSGGWDELPGYSGGTAPAFHRLPSRPFSGTTAARRAVVPARLRRSQSFVKSRENLVPRAGITGSVMIAYDHTCRRCKVKGTPHAERHTDPNLRRCPRCQMKLWRRPIKSKMRFHDLRHTAATLMLRAGVDPHRVQRVLRHASVTTTTGTYAHLAIEDLRDAVSKIGRQPPEPSPFADRLRTSLGNGSASNEDTCPKVPENGALGGAPGGSRTPGPRLRRPLLYPDELQARAPD